MELIINIPSTTAIAEHVQGASYTLAKPAFIALKKHIAMEYGCNNIRAYTLALVNIATEETFNSMSQENKKRLVKKPNEKMGKTRRSRKGSCMYSKL